MSSPNSRLYLRALNAIEDMRTGRAIRLQAVRMKEMANNSAPIITETSQGIFLTAEGATGYKVYRWNGSGWTYTATIVGDDLIFDTPTAPQP